MRNDAVVKTPATAPTSVAEALALLAKKQRDHRQHIHRQIQSPKRQGNGVAPVISLTDVISVVYEYRDEHDNGADRKRFYDLFVKLRVKQLDGFASFLTCLFSS